MKEGSNVIINSNATENGMNDIEIVIGMEGILKKRIGTGWIVQLENGNESYFTERCMNTKK